MEKQKRYFEHPGRAVERDERFEHVMAIALNPVSNYREGIIRCITSREGDFGFKGSVDRSELHMAHGSSLEKFTIGERLPMRGERELVERIKPPGGDFIGFEDPDIWIDEKAGLMHVYFTIPIRNKPEHTRIHLGHAVGPDMSSLEITEPILMAQKVEHGRWEGAKELSVAPVNKNGFRYNLIESGSDQEGGWCSTARVAIAEDMGKPWRYGETAFHPKQHNIPWIGGHASPGPLFSENFMDVGQGKRLGVMNGREANQKVGDQIKYGTFSVGLFIYDYENGKIEWVSPEPLIQDSEARMITFASQFVETGKGEGILYAHVDDSFVRAYTLNADAIKPLLL